VTPLDVEALARRYRRALVGPDLPESALRVASPSSPSPTPEGRNAPYCSGRLS